MKVCLFDIDGTLIASGGAGKAALVAALVELFGLRGGLETLQLSGRTDRAILSDLFRLYGLEESEELRCRLLEAYLAHLPRCLAEGGGQVLPGIAELLDGLHRRTDVLLGLLTGNVREGARVKLGHFGLFDFFRCGGYGDLHLDRDDVAREALAEVRRLRRDHPTDRIWVVGDTPLDVRCARAIGARAVAVCTGWHSADELAACEPDLLCADLSDAAPLLRALAT
jgi:phosphoglycolate phosphatase-like HAD superfamily hydrolase